MKSSKETDRKRASANVKPQEVYREWQQQKRGATAADKVVLGDVGGPGQVKSDIKA